MRKINMTFSSVLSTEILWRYFSDIPNYPQYITYIKEIYLDGIPQKGSTWDDVTKILWIPMKMPHTIIAWEKENRVIYEIKLPFNGIMIQEYKLMKNKNKTGSLVQCTIKFDLGNVLLNSTLGPLLAKRLRYMLVSSLSTIEQKAIAAKKY